MSLLDRIRRQEATSTPGELRRSILDNLRRICSARAGNAPASPVFGIPDALHYSATGPEGLAAIARALRAAISSCEPRILAVSVQPSPAIDGAYGVYVFNITGQVMTGPRSRASVAFRTRLVGSKLSVEE